MTMDKLVIHLSAQELDYVLQCLAQRPFAEVNLLLQNIVAQANEQKQNAPG